MPKNSSSIVKDRRDRFNAFLISERDYQAAQLISDLNSGKISPDEYNRRVNKLKNE